MVGLSLFLQIVLVPSNKSRVQYYLSSLEYIKIYAGQMIQKFWLSLPTRNRVNKDAQVKQVLGEDGLYGKKLRPPIHVSESKVSASSATLEKSK